MLIMKNIVIYGAGGFGREIACLIKRLNAIKPEWNLLGFIDDGIPAGTKNEYGEVLGGIAYLNQYQEPISVALAIGSPGILEELAKKITNHRVSYPNLIDPEVFFLDKETVKLGKGNLICAKTVVSCHVTFGDFNVVNIGAGIGHDAVLGDYNVVMPNVNISGGVTVGNGNLFGVKSTVMQYLKIGDGITLGANSLLIKSVKEKALYMGAPAKKIIV